MAFKIFILAALLTITCAANLGLQNSLLAKTKPLKLAPRVVGGRDAKIGEFPHQVVILKNTIFGYVLHCSGSIFFNNWVLTAGYCVKDIDTSKLKVVAGKNDLDVVESFEQTSYIKDIFIHEKYTGGNSPYDIALLKLNSSFVFNKYVSPLTQPPYYFEYNGTATLAGWGSVSRTKIPKYPSVLQTVEIPTLDFKICNETITSILGWSPLHETNLCTGSFSSGSGSCTGDIGSPLILPDSDGIPTIIGVNSWGFVPCGSHGIPSVYVKVSAFIEWLDNTIIDNSGID